MKPGGGDASRNISHVSEAKKFPGKIFEKFENNAEICTAKTCRTTCPLLKLSNKLSGSIIDTGLHSHLGLVERGVVASETQPDLLSVESSGFPYYRSYKSCGGFQDIVLVKDAGISCTLLDANTNNSKTSGRGSNLVETFLLNQLKIECSDISEITRKISSYTKDILQSLSLRRKFAGSSSRTGNVVRLPKEEINPVAMQYVDKTGRPCLKLRLAKSTKFCRATKSKMVKSISESDDAQSQETYKMQNLTINNKKHVKQLYPKDSGTVKLESSTYSSSSIYDFLMLRNRRNFVEKKIQQVKLSNFENHHSKNRPRKIPDHATMESYRTSAKFNIKNKFSSSPDTLNSCESCKTLKKMDQRSWMSITATESPSLPLSKSQAINIHIVRHKRAT